MMFILEVNMWPIVVQILKTFGGLLVIIIAGGLFIAALMLVIAAIIAWQQHLSL